MWFYGEEGKGDSGGRSMPRRGLTPQPRYLLEASTYQVAVPPAGGEDYPVPLTRPHGPGPGTLSSIISVMILLLRSGLLNLSIILSTPPSWARGGSRALRPVLPARYAWRSQAISNPLALASSISLSFNVSFDLPLSSQGDEISEPGSQPSPLSPRPRGPPR